MFALQIIFPLHAPIYIVPSPRHYFMLFSMCLNIYITLIVIVLAPPKRNRSGSRGVAQTADKRLIPIDSRSIFCAETESEKFSKINLRTKSKKGK